jgi:hypothetical protein
LPRFFRKMSSVEPWRYFGASCWGGKGWVFKGVWCEAREADGAVGGGIAYIDVGGMGTDRGCEINTFTASNGGKNSVAALRAAPSASSSSSLHSLIGSLSGLAFPDRKH